MGMHIDYERNIDSFALFMLYYRMLTGIDVLIRERFRRLRGRRIALCTSYAVCDSRSIPTIEIFKRQSPGRLKAVFAPEHGLYASSQDQIPNADSIDGAIPVYSQYGPRLAPSRQMLSGIDTVVIDLFDIGCRYYTFLWSAILLIKEAADSGVPIMILDRPNPLSGTMVQGPVLDPAYSSFVGLYPIPIRHGMTIGELSLMINHEFGINARLDVVKTTGWNRIRYFHETSLPWTIPSPNMPSETTAYVYPGMCLLEGTNISEGRGTTRPFELFGAPWIDPAKLVKSLCRFNLCGVNFRPVYFQPTFHKFRGRRCGGAQLLVVDPMKLNPIRLGLAVITALRRLYPAEFKWRPPPYEHERVKMPFDILIGNNWVRRDIERGATLPFIERQWQTGLRAFLKSRRRYLLYK